MSAPDDKPSGVPAEVTLTALGRLLELGRSVAPLVAEPDAENWWSASAGLFMRTLTIGETTVHVVQGRAKLADAEWKSRLGLSGLNTLEASYTHVYRGGSWHAHPSALGLSGVRTPAGEHAVYAPEPKSDISPIIGPAFTSLAVTLVVATYTFGRPDPHEIRAVVEDVSKSA